MKHLLWIFLSALMTHAQISDSLLSIMDSAMMQINLQKVQLTASASIVPSKSPETVPTNDSELVVSNPVLLKTLDSLEHCKEALWKAITPIHAEIRKSRKLCYTAQDNVRLLCFLMNKTWITYKTAYMVDSVLLEINHVDILSNTILFEYAQTQPIQGNIKVGIRMKIRALQEERKKLDGLLLRLDSRS